MHFRTRYKLRAMPLFVVAISAALLIVLVFVKQVATFLGTQLPALPWISLGLTISLPVIVGIWYLLSFAEVKRGRLTLRSLRGVNAIDLRSLVDAEVYAKGTTDSKRRRFDLLMRLQDAGGGELWLPLNSWQDEDLLMALVLRATVDRKVRISGDPALVRRFSGLLDTYKSWDRQQAAA